MASPGISEKAENQQKLKKTCTCLDKPFFMKGKEIQVEQRKTVLCVKHGSHIDHNQISAHNINPMLDNPCWDNKF